MDQTENRFYREPDPPQGRAEVAATILRTPSASSGPRDDAGLPVTPPMPQLVKGLFGKRALSYAQAEANCLRDAAKLAGLPGRKERDEQDRLLEQAHRNRAWGDWERAATAGRGG